MKKISKEYLGLYGLVMVAVFWGLGFPALKVVTASIPTFYLIGFRFLIASVFLVIFFHKKLMKISRSLLRSGFILSVLLFLTYIFATVGIQYTSSAKASFFSCLGVLFIPLILKLFFKTSISRRVVISAVICTIGLFLISYTRGMGYCLATGDIICLGASVCGASHVIFTGKLAKGQDAVLLATIQLIFITIFSFITALFLEDLPSAVPPSHIAILIFLAIFCTAIAFVLQTVCQQFISPSRTGFIFAIEPVCGALFSTLLLGDYLGLSGIIGGAMIFGSILFLESDKTPAALPL